MLVEASKNHRGRHGGSGITLADPKLDDLEAIVHACNEEIMLVRFVRMPFDSPRTAPHIDLHERDKGFSGVEQADGVVVTADCEDMFYVGMTLNCRYPCVESASNYEQGAEVTSTRKTYLLLVKMGWVPPCRISQPFILRSSPP